MNLVKYKSWDSHFFGRKIGALNVSLAESKAIIQDQLDHARTSHYDLVYIFSVPGIAYIKDLLTPYNGNLVDNKILFRSELPTVSLPLNRNIYSHRTQAMYSDLLELAILSGKYSRFKLDFRFTQKEFLKLYEQWLINSLSREIADEVLVYKEQNRILGFVTVAEQNGIGTIGLIAVNPLYHGKRIGTALLHSVYTYLQTKGAKEIQVATQERNKAACDFYIANSYEVVSMQEIYHFSL